MASQNAARPAPDLPGSEPRIVISCGGCDSSNIHEIAHKKQVSDWDLAALSDRRFFERFRDRRHYVRPAVATEVQRLSFSGLKPPPPGAAWFCVIKQNPSRLERAWFLATAENIHIEVDEDTAWEIWDGLGVMAGDAGRDA